MNALNARGAITDSPGGIDGRSFHVFERQDRRYLFDRATGSISQLDDFAGTFLSKIEAGLGVSEAIRIHCAEYPGCDGEELQTLLDELQSEGFFRYIPVDHAAQDEMLQRLWFHHPRRIQLLMAQGCNLGCRYCYAWRNGSNQLGTLMSFDVAKASIDYLINKSGARKELQVTFFGGEPLLNWEVLKQAIQYCEIRGEELGKSFSFEVTTNAVLLTKEKVQFLASKRAALMVSVDGWKEMHDYNRPNLGKDSNYDEILENAQYANSYYKLAGLWPIKVRANLTHKYHDGTRVLDYLRESGFDRVAVAGIEPLPHANASPGAMTDDDCDEYNRAVEQRVSAILDKLQEDIELTSFEKESIQNLTKKIETLSLKGVVCGVGRNTQCVDNKGNIYPCHRYEGMQAYIIGDVYAGLSEDRTMRYYRAVNGNATARCHSCWIRDYCGGGCAWLLSSASGVIVDPTERECDRRRSTFEYYLHTRTRLRELRPEYFEDELISFNHRQPTESKTQISCGTGCTSCGS